MFYDNFIKACHLMGVTPSAALQNAGINKSAGTRWKKGHVPTDATLQKLVDYFGIPKAVLLGESLQAKSSPALKGAELQQEVDQILEEIKGMDRQQLALIRAAVDLAKKDSGK